MYTVKYYALTFLFLCFAGQLVENFKAYFPPSKETSHPRILVGTLPALNEFTLCSWIRHILRNNSTPHLFSYATKRNDDKIAVFIKRNDNNVTLGGIQIRNQLVNYNCPSVDWNSFSWRHICVSWLGLDGSIKFFVNGQRCSLTQSVSSGISFGEPILGGGIAIIGQGQDDLRSKFDFNQAWYGDITGFNLWGEALSDNKIREAGKCNGSVNSGTIISWSKTPMAVYDGIVIRQAEVCEP